VVQAHRQSQRWWRSWKSTESPSPVEVELARARAQSSPARTRVPQAENQLSRIVFKAVSEVVSGRGRRGAGDKGSRDHGRT
jgi:hypothetical protein